MKNSDEFFSIKAGLRRKIDFYSLIFKGESDVALKISDEIFSVKGLERKIAVLLL